MSLLSRCLAQCPTICSCEETDDMYDMIEEILGEETRQRLHNS